MGINYINMFPTEGMKKEMAHMHIRSPGKSTTHFCLLSSLGGPAIKRVVSRGQNNDPPRRPFAPPPSLCASQEDKDSSFHSGGAGCFAKPSEYCQIIATLLNDGTHPKTGNQIFKPETVEEMFTNQIPETPNFGRQGISLTKLALSNPLAELYPQPHDHVQGYGLSFFQHVYPGPTGRSRSTGWWAGLPNLFWWADRENGLGGFVASQVLPFGGTWLPLSLGLAAGWLDGCVNHVAMLTLRADASVMALSGEIEAGLYANVMK